MKKYLIVGVACTLINNIILIAGDKIGIHYTIGVFAAFIVSGAIAYFSHSSFTFSATQTARGYLRFMGGQTMGLVISMALMGVMCTGMGLPVWIATPITTALLFVYNYSAARWAILN